MKVDTLDNLYYQLKHNEKVPLKSLSHFFIFIKKARV